MQLSNIITARYERELAVEAIEGSLLGSNGRWLERGVHRMTEHDDPGVECRESLPAQRSEGRARE